MPRQPPGALGRVPHRYGGQSLPQSPAVMPRRPYGRDPSYGLGRVPDHDPDDADDDDKTGENPNDDKDEGSGDDKEGGMSRLQDQGADAAKDTDEEGSVDDEASIGAPHGGNGEGHEDKDGRVVCCHLPPPC